MYERVVKRGIDFLLSSVALICFSWLYLLIALAIRIDDPGPAVFTQTRIGKGKKPFRLFKFRSMKMDSPHDVPTHLLANPEQYITRVGRFLRRSSLDELPQVLNIWNGSMAVVGPRPALWNQDDLIAERDRYGANDVRPGLTGWAQISGRDELEIPEKARLDGEYTAKLKAGGLRAFLFDCRCFLGTIAPVLRGDGVVEGAAACDDYPPNPEDSRKS